MESRERVRLVELVEETQKVLDSRKAFLAEHEAKEKRQIPRLRRQVAVAEKLLESRRADLAEWDKGA